MSTALTQPETGRLARPSLLPEDTGPDWDCTAEQAVLGGILLVPSMLSQVRDVVKPADFYLPSHRRLFSGALELVDRGCPIDPITLGDHVRQDPEAMAEGNNYIWALPPACPSALSAPHYARIVKDLAMRRRARDVGWALLENRITAAEAQTCLLELGAAQTVESLPTILALDFCREVPEEPEWILEGYLARGAITELDAKIKTGKTHFTTDLIRAILAGEEFLGRKTLLTPVLYLTEERPTTFRAALTRVGLDQTDGLHLTFRQNVRLTWKDMGRAVIAKTKRHGIGLVVVDTLSDWSGLEADMENDAGAALCAMRPLQEMAAAGLAVLVLRHERKSGGDVGESARGSSAFGGAADILLSLKKDQAAGQENRRILEAVGRLEGWAPRLVLEMTDGHYRSLGTSAQVEADKARAFLLESLPTSESQALPEKELLGQAEGEVSRSTLKRALEELVSQGTALRAKGAGSAPARAYGFWKEER